MQFTMSHKVGTGTTVIFTSDMFKMKQDVINTLKNHFDYIGGRLNDNGEYTFPLFITSQVIQEIIHNTCFICGGLMKDGQALDNTTVCFDDFGGDAFSRGSTCSKIGQPVIKQVRKCTICGHSHT